MKPTNPALLVRVAEWLENGAKHIDVNGNTILGFNMREGVIAVQDETNQCGTLCCIAGAVIQFSNKPIITNASISQGVKPGERKTQSYGAIFGTARSLCGMTGDDAIELFEPEHVNWSEITPSRAAAVVRNYITTGDVDWS